MQSHDFPLHISPFPSLFLSFSCSFLFLPPYTHQLSIR
jgi:hypothetical protein